MIDLFYSLNSLGSWFLFGIIFGAGFVAVIVAAVKISDNYFEHHTTKKEEKQKKQRQLKIEQERNLIVIPQQLHSWIFHTTGNVGRFQKTMEEMRKEFWQKDIIVPYFFFFSNPDEDAVSLIKAEGNVIFEGSFYDKENNTTDEQAEALLLEKLRDFYNSKIKNREEAAK